MAVGAQITTLNLLVVAARNRRAVVAPSTGMLKKPRPAAVVLSMQARIVADVLDRGLFLYIKEK